MNALDRWLIRTFARLRRWLARLIDSPLPQSDPLTFTALRGSPMLVTLSPNIVAGDKYSLTYTITTGGVAAAPVTVAVAAGTTFDVPVGSSLTFTNSTIDAHGNTWLASDPVTFAVPGKSDPLTFTATAEHA